MKELHEEVGIPLPAPNFKEINKEIEAILNPQTSVRYQDDQITSLPQETEGALPKKMGRHGVRLYLIKQVRDDIAAVFAFPGRKYHENI